MNATHPQPTVTAGDRLGLTLFLAIALHSLVIVGIGFQLDDPQREVINTLDVTLVSSRAEEAPDEVAYLAPEHQAGGGNTAERVRPEPSATAPSTSEQQGPAEQDTPQAAPPAPPHPAPEQLTRERAPEKAPLQMQKTPAAEPAPRSAAELMHRSREIARLEAQLETAQRIYSQRPDPKYLTAATRKASDAAYLRYWTDKVEKIGNLNYPDEARRAGLSGRLRLEAIVRPDGTLQEVQLMQSSGHPVLDEAAQRIVQLAAPFAPVPPDVLGERSEVRIVRTWVFTSDALSSQ